MGLRVIGSLDLDTFASSLNDERTIDLGGTTFVDVCGIVGVACLADGNASRGASPHVILPTRQEVASYLSRMRMGWVLTDTAAVLEGPSLPTVRVRPGADQLVSLLEIRSEWETEEVANLVWSRIEGTVDPAVAIALFEALTELGSNAVQHSGAARAFAAGQTFRRESENEYVVVAIGDSGIGIRASLTSRFEPSSDSEALRLALTADVSASGERGRGQGLPSTVESVTALGGELVVHSGSAVAVCRRGGQEVRATRGIPGTLVAARIPCRPSG